MGLDLSLLPIHANVTEPPSTSTCIDLLRREELFEVISAIPARPMPLGVQCHYGEAADDEERRYGCCKMDPCGDPITWVTAGELAALKDHPEVLDSAQNRAAWAYLCAMKPDARVVLYWH
jgi:hypothetical protein